MSLRNDSCLFISATGSTIGRAGAFTVGSWFTLSTTELRLMLTVMSTSVVIIDGPLYCDVRLFMSARNAGMFMFIRCALKSLIVLKGWCEASIMKMAQLRHYVFCGPDFCVFRESCRGT